jgi:hypothetical protein
MAKVAPASVVVRSSSADSARHALSELVMAWARDSATGQPRYIGEIDAAHRGGKCGCECPSCGLPLIAVNAAKDEVIRRPHFRHPDGAQRDDCGILAARAAALRTLAEHGYIELPRRARSANFVGLSGTCHEAWADLPPRRVKVSQVSYQDRAFALLTLDDGRQIRVALTGSIQEGADSSEQALVPVIAIDVDESIAGMDAASIRQRLELLSETVCWQSHWDDDRLRQEAETKAKLQAIERLDWPADDIEFPDGLSAIQRRETLLHFEVKRILQSAGQMAVPGFEVIEEIKADGFPTLRREHKRGVTVLTLSNTRLESRVGKVIPDVVTDASADGAHTSAPLLIEVTVTNHIDEERQDRIETLGLAALEIDFSLAGGQITRSALKDLVVHDIALKRWLANPEMAAIRAALRSELQEELSARREILRLVEERRTRVLAEPLDQVAFRYLTAAEHFLIATGALSDCSAIEIDARRNAMAACVEEMKWRGFPEAGDEDLLGHHRMLARILSIKRDTGIGYGYKSGFEVLNAIRQSGAKFASDWTVYLIAAKVFTPAMNQEQQAWFGEWRDEVARRIRVGDFRVTRHAIHDCILGTLFPAMAESLSKPFGKRRAVPDARWDERSGRFEPAFQQRRPRTSEFLGSSEAGGLPTRGADRGDLASWFLQGAELEAWKRANPESAKAWEPVLKKLGREA